jgi:hypothetical protein
VTPLPVRMPGLRSGNQALLSRRPPGQWQGMLPPRSSVSFANEREKLILGWRPASLSPQGFASIERVHPAKTFEPGEIGIGRI